MRALLIRLGHWLFRARNGVFPLVFLALVALGRPGVPGLDPRWDRWLDVAGILVALSGQVLRALVIGLAYIRRGGLNKRIHADVLVTEGLFAHSRNPLYVGNYLGLVGFCLIHNSWLTYLIGLPLFGVAYLAIVLAEEQFLAAKFGADYEAYCRRVPRFWPRLSGLGTTLSGMQFDWRRVVRKDYGTAFSGFTVILALLAWNEVQRSGWAAARPMAILLFGIWVPGLLAYVIARYFKKAGRFGVGGGEAPAVRAVR